MNDATKHYTAFWPVFVVFACFTITNIVNLVGNLQMRSSLGSALGQLEQGASQAQAKRAALSGLAHDLIDLAPSSPVAQQIVSDFHIQLRSQPGQAATGAPAPAPAAEATANPPKPSP